MPKRTTHSSGYTYLGQFIDHDLTFDPNSSLQKQNDLEALVDFRTPRFDLDCVYGRGPNDQQYMYRDDNFFLFGRRLSGSTFDKNTRDLPRNNPDPLGSNRANARALIGDPRNDENVIVSQLQESSCGSTITWPRRCSAKSARRVQGHPAGSALALSVGDLARLPSANPRHRGAEARPSGLQAAQTLRRLLQAESRVLQVEELGVYPDRGSLPPRIDSATR
jgi:hypothetical protein